MNRYHWLAGLYATTLFTAAERFAAWQPGGSGWLLLFHTVTLLIVSPLLIAAVQKSAKGQSWPPSS